AVGGVDQRSGAGQLPLLRGVGAAVVDDDERARGGGVAVGVEAPVEDLHGPVGADGPLLRVAAVAGVDLDLVADGGDGLVVVNAPGPAAGQGEARHQGARRGHLAAGRVARVRVAVGGVGVGRGPGGGARRRVATGGDTGLVGERR